MSERLTYLSLYKLVLVQNVFVVTGQQLHASQRARWIHRSWRHFSNRVQGNSGNSAAANMRETFDILMSFVFVYVVQN